MIAPRPPRGFTLVEVLIAVAITAVIGAMVAGSFQQIDHAARIAEDQAERTAGARMALTRLSHELAEAYISEHYDHLRYRDRPTLFRGEGDRLLFTTMAHRRLYRGARESDEEVVEYTVGSDPSGAGEALFRREHARIDDQPDQGGRTDLVADHVQSISIRYWDWKRKEWVREWSTRSPDRLYELPTRVRVELAVVLADGRTETFATEARPAITAPLDF